MIDEPVVSGGIRIADLNEQLVRRGRRSKRPKKQEYTIDQETGRAYAKVSVFEPHPVKDKYLSVNRCRSLEVAGHPLIWPHDNIEFFACILSVRDCQEAGCWVTAEPIVDEVDPLVSNPHHAGVWGLVEIRDSDPDLYDSVITRLRDAAKVII